MYVLLTKQKKKKKKVKNNSQLLTTLFTNIKCYFCSLFILGRFTRG